MTYTARSDARSPKQSAAGRPAISPALIAAWVLLLLALSFFIPFGISTGVGIVEAVATSSGPPSSSDADAGGLGFILMVVGLFALGIGLAYGLARYQTRNRANDPISEEATRAQYDDPARFDRRRGEFVDRLQPSEPGHAPGGSRSEDQESSRSATVEAPMSRDLSPGLPTPEAGESEVLDTGQEEVFSRTEVELGRTEHLSQSGSQWHPAQGRD